MMTIASSTHIKINSARLQTELEELGQIGETDDSGISRLALSNDDLAARAWLANRIEEAGLLLRDDEVGNLGGILYSNQADARTLLIGSHLDSVPNGGKYDGSVGILAGLECLRRIKEEALDLPFHVEVIDFTDQEGNWQSFFGSMGLTGTLREIQVNDLRQDTAAFRAALYRAGILPHEIHKAQRDPQSLLGYLELHIEQGDRLYQSGVDIGVVTGVVGRTTYHITFLGESSHAATTRRENRRDALHAAAQAVVQFHQLVDEFPEGIVNCGDVRVKPGAFNVIPSEAVLRVECRHSDETTLHAMERRLIQLAEEIAARHHLRVECREVLHRPAVRMAEPLLQVIDEICDEAGCKHQRMVSLAGHDAQILSPFTPTAMIFLPSVEGYSHNPREFTEWQHIELGANILLQTVLKLAYQV